MNNDLISRYALMNALRENVLVEVTPELENAIEDQPTAYDIDKVVEQLGKTKEIYSICGGALHVYAVRIDKAIGIVKGGNK